MTIGGNYSTGLNVCSEIIWTIFRWLEMGRDLFDTAPPDTHRISK